MTEADLLREQGSEPPEKRILHDLGYFGHFLHLHRGGRSGKQHILLVLLKSGSEMTQRELQERSYITSASLSEVVSKLEAEGLISRTRSESDRRTLMLRLTDEGGRQAREELRSRGDFEGHAFSCLSSAEVEQLAETLDLLAAHWEDLDQREKRGETACSKS
ncbi:MarR family winged helix-turn-helix transcriptional regulator [Thermophilibacter immobilis]|uniref:Winged helix-turn-helix transcriptional regulator n=1 Tax=Thermophilibacter immobilis TaxID=2779519 RepID=A0A7S7RTZ1_9ACTN|nr:MarR family winged helix-turn-helix transcriptional regulator [Thermophilibacter immobilis]QOY60033.1 winged helix-turn-helix transcriptional regulator [Thermophilibacter immobilis]